MENRAGILLILSKLSTLFFLKIHLFVVITKATYMRYRKTKMEKETPTIPITQKQTAAKNLGKCAVTIVKTYSGKNHQ